MMRRRQDAALLSVRNLRVEFPTRHGVLVAVDDLSIDIHPGEVLGMVGESGAGKSMTGNAVIGLLEPPGHVAAGTIHLDGEAIDPGNEAVMRRVRGRRIGMIFQDPLTSLNPLYSIGYQLVETIRTHLPMNESQARERAIKLLDDVGIPAAAERLDSYPHQFSGGMRQRVVIALALAGEPELIIADEPTTALDVSVQAQILSLLKHLCRDKGTAILLITHDMGVIAETADHVAVLYAGRLAEVGPVDSIVRAPSHPYTRGLMDSIPRLEEDREMLVQIEGSMPRLSEIPSGCAFHPRCPRAWARCQRERPEPLRAGEGRAACWLYDPRSAPPRSSTTKGEHGN